MAGVTQAKRWFTENGAFANADPGTQQGDPLTRRTNVQQLTCNIDLSCSFYYRFFSFVLLELTPFVLKGKVLGEKNEKV